MIPGDKVKKREGDKIVETVLVKNKNEFLDLWNKARAFGNQAIEKIMNVSENDFGAIKYNFIPNTTTIPVIGALLVEYQENHKKKINEKKLLENTQEMVLVCGYIARI